MTVGMMNIQLGASSLKIEVSDGAGTVVLYTPVRTVSEANQGGKLRVKMKRHTEQRFALAMLIKPAQGWVKFPCTIRLTRMAKSKIPLDSDNLPSSLKHVRDGVADGLGRDDGHKSGITWAYRQVTGRKEYGVRVEIVFGGVELPPV